MEAVSEPPDPFHDPKWTVVPQDEPAVTGNPLEALVSVEESEEDEVSHLVFDFPSVPVGVLLHLPCRAV